ncbi:MAG: hypothetical protein ABJB74_11655 [Gemmatimonas sp.]
MTLPRGSNAVRSGATLASALQGVQGRRNQLLNPDNHAAIVTRATFAARD